MPDYVLPEENRGWWTIGTDCGVDGGIDQYRPGGASERTFEIDVTAAPYNADNTGATNCSAAIQSAISAATAGQVVYLPAGTYRVSSFVFVPSGKNDITIRGDGASTIVFLTGSGRLNIVGTSQAYGLSPRTLSGTMTKGTRTLTVSSSSGYGVGELATVIAENEYDNARIQAGAAPTWSQYAYPGFRRVCVRIVAVTATTITIDPPLPWDMTYVGGRIERGGSQRVERVGFEDFNIAFDPASHPLFGIFASLAINCWAYNVNVLNWTKTGSNGSLISINNSHKFEVRHCDGIAALGSSSDGVLQPLYSSSCAFLDCAFINFDVGIYSSGKTYNCVFAFCFAMCAQAGSQSGINLSHGGGDALNLVEGCVINNIGLDGYHGSGSHMTLLRNWVHGTNASQTLRGYQIAHRRFTRGMVHIGNVFGIDGWSAPSISLGNPNIGNAFNNGGTSDTTTGDFWADWQLTGTLTTRTSDSSGVVTASGGDWASVVSGGGLVSLYWGSGTESRLQMSIVSRSGNVLTLSGGSGTALPTAGTTFALVQPNTAGFQELDLAVAATTTSVHNYECSQVGTGGVVNALSGDTVVPESLCYPSGRPSWWPTSLAWPAVTPNSPTFDYEILPAAYRYYNGVDAPSGALAAPVITADPQTQTYTEGDEVTLSANASGNPTPTWSWTKNGSPISGATSRFLSLPNISEADEGTYVAIATNSQGTDSSAGAVITVNAAADVTPPTPNPSTIDAVTVNSSSRITVTATVSTDAVSSPVEYNHAIDGTYQGWQASPTRVFSGLADDTAFAFRVKARDAAGNETTQSSATNASTPPEDTITTGNPAGNRGTRALVFGVF